MSMEPKVIAGFDGACADPAREVALHDAAESLRQGDAPSIDEAPASSAGSTLAASPLPHLCVRAGSEAHIPEARRLARRFGCAVTSGEESGSHPVHLLVGAEGLSLVGAGMTMHGDLARLAPRLRHDKLGRELLVKAAKVKGLSDAREPGVARLLAVDATAGMGEDSLLLAAAGFEVLMFERNPVIAALLADALRRAADVPELAEAVSRMHLRCEDSIGALCRMEREVAVVLLDPMFPARTKSAAVKKKFQLLHMIEQPCSDEESLLEAARAVRPRKIVVKRPPKGPYLAGAKPAHSLEGKAVRYDVIVPSR